MKSDAILFSPAIQSQTKIAKCDQLFKFPKTHSLPIHCGSPRAHTLSNHSPPPHFAGRSLTLRVVFYLPERCRDCETARRQDSRTPKNASPPSHFAGRLPRFAGRFLPTRALWGGDRGTTRPRDDGTTRQPHPKHSPPPHYAGLLVRSPPKKTPHSPHFASRLRVLRVGFYLPIRFRGLRDDGTTRRRDNGTTGQRDTCPPKRTLPLSRCGSHHVPPQKRLATLPHCGSSSRLAGTKNSTFASKSSFRHA